MFWEELTGDEFPRAVEQAQQVCLLPLSCIERHAHHMPLGTDMFIGRELCRRAADLEPAVIFPNFIFTQILEARHVAGTVAIAPDLIVSLLENVLSEIARNGLKKIVLVNAHGGNNALIQFMAQRQLASPRNYALYVAEPPLAPDDQAAVSAQWESTYDGHAGELETSAILAVRPDLVHMDQVRGDEEGKAQGRLKPLRDAGVTTGIWWYADHPTHYSGEASPSTAEKGERWYDSSARALANAIRLIKADQETQRLQNEFFSASTGH